MADHAPAPLKIVCCGHHPIVLPEEGRCLKCGHDLDGGLLGQAYREAKRDWWDLLEEYGEMQRRARQFVPPRERAA